MNQLPNPLHRMEPHRNLPMQVRRVLWSACERVLVSPGEYAAAAAWLAEAFSERAMQQREQQNHGTPERAWDRVWRLQQAVRAVLAEDLSGEDALAEERLEARETRARRIILLACLVSYPRELPLRGEFCSWTWESAGTSFAAWLDRELSETYVAGRNAVLFGPESSMPDVPDWLDALVPLVKRATAVLQEVGEEARELVLA